MPTFDSAEVEDLVERARTPLDAGALNDEVISALAEMELTGRDRGHLLLAQLVMLQGTMSAEEAAAQAGQVVDLLRQHADVDALVSALAVAAAIFAATGDQAACLDQCLDMAGIIRANPDSELTYRAAANFGAALIVLGAYNLSAPLFVSGIQASLQDNEPIGVVICCTNLAIALSRRALVTGTPILSDAESLEQLDTLDRALQIIRASGPAEEMSYFVSAVLAHSSQLRGDFVAAAEHWGDLDALTAHSSPSFVQYLCLVEAPLALRQGDIERAHLLVERASEHLATPHIVPLGRVDALNIRSLIHEHAGDMAAALQDARSAADLALQETNGLADLLIAQVDKRAALEEGQRALLDQASYLSEQALVDELSQVGNRRAYEAMITSLGQAPEHELAVLLCDIDHFKQVNDQFGHTFGDAVIERVAAIATQAAGGSDRVFRYGGDEFVLLPEAGSTERAAAVADDILQAVTAEKWQVNGRQVDITCSIGVWVGLNTDIEQGIAEADRQMYEAKLAGRNTVRVARSIGGQTAWRTDALEQSRQH